MPIAPWLQPADPVGSFMTGANLALRIKQEKDRREQLEQLAEYRRSLAQTALERVRDQNETALSRLSEMQTHHAAMEEYSNKLADVRQQLADLQGKKLTATEQDKKDKLLQQHDEFTKKLEATQQMASDRNDTTLQAAGMRADTTERGQDLTDAQKTAALKQASQLAGRRLDFSNQKAGMDDATKITLGLMNKPVAPLDPASAATTGQYLANLIRNNFARSQAMQAAGQTNQPVGAPVAAPAAPIPGATASQTPRPAVGGYKIGARYKGGLTYLGGDPKDPASWQQPQ